MSQSRALLEDIRALIPVAAVNSAALADQPAFAAFWALLQSMQDSPELETLSAEELRAFKTLLITLTRAGTMTPMTGRYHVGAVWRGTAKQAVLKLPIGPKAKRLMHELLHGDA